jgi:Sporulation and spore germination/Immunoglobulin-like domain of bacterial spore germination
MKPIGKLNVFCILILWLVACAPTSPTPVATGGPAQITPAPTSPAATQPAAPTPAPTQPALPPTAGPTLPPATPTTPPRSIVLEAPQSGAIVANPVPVRGQVSVTPFESTLRGRVYDAGGQVVGEGPVMVAATMGQPGTFEGAIAFQAGPGGPGRVELADISPKDGSVLVSAVVEVSLAPEAGTTTPPAPGAGLIEVPAAEARVTLPLHLLARVGQPGEQVIASLRWQDGTELKKSFATLQGEDGSGLLIDDLNWPGESQPPEPPTQPATLEIYSGSGDVLARQAVTVLNPNGPDVQPITLYFLLGEDLQPVQRLIPKTAGIGKAALEELLWGPGAPNLAGFGTAIPTPQEVLSYAGREPDWGPRVTLLKLTIVNGVATADFSQEMQAYGGGSLRVMLLAQQIEQTLKQFPTVNEVVIAVEGQTEGVLQP